jgi:hypothetical protein
LPSDRTTALLYHCGNRPPGASFDLSHFQTGEGFAAFGKGIYFATRRAVAEQYCKYASAPWLTIAVLNKPLLNVKRLPAPTREEVLTRGYAGIRIPVTTGPKRFAEIVVYDPDAIHVVQTLDMQSPRERAWGPLGKRRGRAVIREEPGRYVQHAFPGLPRVDSIYSVGSWTHGTTLHDAVRLAKGRKKRRTRFRRGPFKSLEGLYLYPGEDLDYPREASIDASFYFDFKRTELWAHPTILVVDIGWNVQALLDEDVLIEPADDGWGGELIAAYADVVSPEVHARWTAVQDADRRTSRKEVDELTRILTPILQPSPTDRWPVRALPPFRFVPSAWALAPKERYPGAYRHPIIVIEGSLR